MDGTDEHLIEARKKNATKQARDSKGHFIKSQATTTPSVPPPTTQDPSPLASLIQTSNTEVDPSSKKLPKILSVNLINPFLYPIEFLKSLLRKSNVDFHAKIPPVAVPFVVIGIFIGGASVGWFGKSVQAKLASVPVVNTFIPVETITPSPDPWRQTAYSGLLKQTGFQFFLVTADAEAITLQVPNNVSLEKYVGKRIFATGKYNTVTKILLVSEASDLEILPTQAQTIPTFTPTPTLTNTPTPTNTHTPTPTPSFTPVPTFTPTSTLTPTTST